MTKDFTYSLFFAKYIDEADLNKIKKIIIGFGDSRAIFSFAKNLKSRKNNINMSELEDAMIATGDIDEMFYFAEYIDSVDRKKMFDAILRTSPKSASDQVTKEIIEREYDDLLEQGTTKEDMMPSW
jgi:hypothetical protein